jgi:hypothetical protein
VLHSIGVGRGVRVFERPPFGKKSLKLTVKNHHLKKSFNSHVKISKFFENDPFKITGFAYAQISAQREHLAPGISVSLQTLNSTDQAF